MTRAVFVDAETTALGPERLIWEITFIEAEIGRAALAIQKPATFQVHLNEVEVARADPISLEIGRFNERRWPFERLISPHGLAQIAQTRTASAMWYGNVPNFDTESLAKVMREWGMLPHWDYHLQCCEVLAAGFLAARGIPHDEMVRPASESRTGNPSLDHRKIVRLLEKETGEQIATAEDALHTSEGDALECVRMAAAVYGLPIAQVEG